MIPAPYAVLSPPPSPPSSENLTLIVVVLAIAMAVVLAGLFVAVFSVWPLSVPTGPAPRSIGVNLARSSDGTNWVLTFTSVPTGLSPFTTMLTVLTGGGATALPATPLSSLYNYSSQGALYSQYQPGGPVAVGDRLLISTAIYPAGYGYRLSDATTTFASGPLQ